MPAQTLSSLVLAAGVAPADSARVVSQAYTVSLLAVAPLLAAAIAGVALRRSAAIDRLQVWRAALLALLLVVVSRQLPTPFVAWVVPSALAQPLVELGRAGLLAQASTTPDALDLLAVAYVAGVILVLLPMLRAWARVRALGHRAQPLRGHAWDALLAETRACLGVRRIVRLVGSAEVATPMTWGLWRPTIALPLAAEHWSHDHRRAALLHEMTHVRRGDAPWLLMARVVCALYWFHPGAWWVARGLRRECERACDARVLSLGVRRSAYAQLLLLAADGMHAPAPATGAALARAGGLRERLADVLDASRAPRARWSRQAAVAASAVLLASAPATAVELAPTREVLAGLVRDARWESRAYAVVGLAQRRDSVELAREVARQDPSPRVRAWAKYALAQGTRDSLIAR